MEDKTLEVVVDPMQHVVSSNAFGFQLNTRLNNSTAVLLGWVAERHGL